MKDFFHQLEEDLFGCSFEGTVKTDIHNALISLVNDLLTHPRENVPTLV